jgi:hypothetical protein
VQKLGLVVYHVPGTAIVHHGGASSSTQPSQFSVITMRAANERYIRLNDGASAAYLYRLFQGLSAIARVALVAPGFLLIGTPVLDTARNSFIRWWHVLKWSLGLVKAKAK